MDLRATVAAGPAATGQGPTGLARAVGRCQENGRFLSALRGLYHDVDAAVMRRGAICLGGGACCKFDLTDHRLYLSTGELALLALKAPENPARCALRRCPYQVGPRCAGRDRRPLGCRVFFCAPRLAEWSCQTYQRFHRRIQQLHEEHAVAYLYLELVPALRELLHACADGRAG